MELFQLARKRAGENLRMADHMLHVTYPSLNDPKLLLGVVDHMYHAWEEAVNALVSYERLFKGVPPFSDTVENRSRVFTEKLVDKYNIRSEHVSVFRELQEIRKLHVTSPIEFRKQDQFVICTDKYHIKTIHAKQLKVYLIKTKEFLTLVRGITAKHERIFGRS